MPFHKPLVQARQDELEAAEARRRKDEAEEKAEEDNINERMALCDEKSACPSSPSSPASPTEQPASPALAADELHPEPSMPAFPTEQPASPTLAANEFQSGPAPSMPASPTEQPAPPVQSQDARGASPESRARRPPSMYPGTPPVGSKARTMSPLLDCVNRPVTSQMADFTLRPIASPARRPEGSQPQRGLAVPRCETEVQDQIVSNSLSVPMAETSAGQGQDQIVANPPAVPMAASQSALVAFEPEAAGNSGAGQLLAEYYSMLASCTTQVACAY
jgi:hypothetical protein